MAALSYFQTKLFIDLILKHSDTEKLRLHLHRELIKIQSNEGQLYEGIAKHGLKMNLTQNQWFDLLCKLPNRLFRSQILVEKLISEEQIKNLPPLPG